VFSLQATLQYVWRYACNSAPAEVSILYVAMGKIANNPVNMIYAVMGARTLPKRYDVD
jgi:hypothetical protein